MQHAAGQSIKEMYGSMQLAPWRPVWRRHTFGGEVCGEWLPWLWRTKG
jgi:hypothetical protein